MVEVSQKPGRLPGSPVATAEVGRRARRTIDVKGRDVGECLILISSRLLVCKSDAITHPACPSEADVTLRVKRAGDLALFGDLCLRRGIYVIFLTVGGKSSRP